MIQISAGLNFDILFLITAILLVFSGSRGGFIFSLMNLLSLPIGFVVAWLFGPQLTKVMAATNLSATPMISYVLLFFAAVLIVHILMLVLRRGRMGLVGLGDTALGGIVGFVEAWLLWVVVLLILYNFLRDVNQVHTLGINTSLFHRWQQFYNHAVVNSLFAEVNSFIIGLIPASSYPK